MLLRGSPEPNSTKCYKTRFVILESIDSSSNKAQKTESLRVVTGVQKAQLTGMYDKENMSCL